MHLKSAEAQYPPVGGLEEGVPAQETSSSLYLALVRPWAPRVPPPLRDRTQWLWLLCNIFYLFTSDVTENVRTPPPESQILPLIQCFSNCGEHDRPPDNAHSVAFSQHSSSPRLIEDETFNDRDIINNLINYEDGQEPDSLRVDKICNDPAFKQIVKAFSKNRYQ
ncbi:uncharacterized protein TNCV_3159441 [Trichonephila clavipes]|nr:uncharacterized protein TNCV_3159441 [Trichonephila clavipes]